jgi:hypothetical protein
MPGIRVVQRGKRLPQDGNCNEMPCQSHTRYRNSAMSDEVLHQITPEKEKELVHRSKKRKKNEKEEKDSVN